MIVAAINSQQSWYLLERLQTRPSCICETVFQSSRGRGLRRNTRGQTNTYKKHASTDRQLVAWLIRSGAIAPHPTLENTPRCCCCQCCTSTHITGRDVAATHPPFPPARPPCAHPQHASLGAPTLPLAGDSCSSSNGNEAAHDRGNHTRVLSQGPAHISSVRHQRVQLASRDE